MAEAKADRIAKNSRKVNQEMLDAILLDIEEGAPRKHAAESHGIHESTFHNLIRQGLVDMLAEQNTLEYRLVVSLRNIEKAKIKSCVTKIEKGKYGHKGCEWILEQVYWRYFGGSAQARELIADMEELRNQLKEAGNGDAKSSGKEQATKE